MHASNLRMHIKVEREGERVRATDVTVRRCIDVYSYRV